MSKLLKINTNSTEKNGKLKYKNSIWKETKKLVDYIRY